MRNMMPRDLFVTDEGDPQEQYQAHPTRWHGDDEHYVLASCLVTAEAERDALRAKVERLREELANLCDRWDAGCLDSHDVLDARAALAATEVENECADDCPCRLDSSAACERASDVNDT